MSLENRVVVISGGSGGLGSYLAVALAKETAKIAVLYHLGVQRAEQVVQTIERLGGQAMAIQTDVSESDSVATMAKAVVASWGSLDILINCAGVSYNNVSWKLSDADWRSTLDINLTGTFLCSRAVLPTMRSQMWGRIINITSIVGQIGVVGTSAYAASKAGLVGMTRSMALEVAAKGITVNALALGYFDAGIISNVPADMLKDIVASIPVKRLGRLEELSHAVKFLCADESAYITGQTLNINGGLYLG